MLKPLVSSAPFLSAVWKATTSTLSKSLSVMLAVASKPATESVRDSVPSMILSSIMGMRTSNDETPSGTVRLLSFNTRPRLSFPSALNVHWSDCSISACGPSVSAVEFEEFISRLTTCNSLSSLLKSYEYVRKSFFS